MRWSPRPSARMSTTTPPGARDCPRTEWPCPRGDTGNGTGDDVENRMSSAMSAAVAGCRTASGAASTMRPKSDDALAVELRSVWIFEAIPRATRSLGRPPAGIGRSWPATAERKLAMQRRNAARQLLAMSLQCQDCKLLALPAAYCYCFR
uniref:Predicted protein n=1 Tax=Hordeum vulgare subsp. vulgare TaxID=112509 RepID=F2EG14_HORVV|nr:predicted protein [Hordeum vulgare subsp. vulgare]